jgi:hypothetical protein
MENRFDELTKMLAGDEPEGCASASRRDALRKVGLGLAGALLASLGFGSAWAGGGGTSACKQYCQRFPSGSERNHCLQVCQACPSTTRLCGTNGLNLSCCSAGATCCSGVCTDLTRDSQNCGGCGRKCASYPNVQSSCIGGACSYSCYAGYADCDGSASNGCEIYLGADPRNCGACGHICPPAAPYCVNAACAACPDPTLTACASGCADLTSDPNNCGACGNLCAAAAPYCVGGTCSECPEGLTLCSGTCISVEGDPANCGSCGSTCPVGPCWACCCGGCYYTCDPLGWAACNGCNAP